MDLSIHVQASGMTAAFALCLDVLPHQITAMAHVTSILQMCISYMESRPAQVEAQKELKAHMDRVSFIQKKILRKKRNSVVSQGRAVRPLPAILGSENENGSEREADGSQDSFSKEPERQMGEETPAGEHSDDDQTRPIIRTGKKSQAVSGANRPHFDEPELFNGEPTPGRDSQEPLASSKSFDGGHLPPIPGEVRPPPEVAPQLPQAEEGESSPSASVKLRAGKCNTARAKMTAEVEVAEQAKKVKKKKARTTFAWLQTLVPSQMAVWRGSSSKEVCGAVQAATASSELGPIGNFSPVPSR